VVFMRTHGSFSIHGTDKGS